MKARFFPFVATLLLAGCGVEASPEGKVEGADQVAIPQRQTTVLIDSCVLDTWQSAELESKDMQHVVSEIVLLCLVPQYDGTIAPSDPSGVAALTSLVQYIHGLGYTAKLGVAFTDESGQRSDGDQATVLLNQPAWQTTVTSAIVNAAVATNADGIDIDFELLQPSARASVTTFVRGVGAALHAKGKKIALYVPPVTTLPSDIPSAGAYDLAQFDGAVDRIRVTTLDYSNPSPGPTIDPGWAVDAVNFTRRYVKATPIDISYPLYGADFGPKGIRGTSWLEARALADDAHIGDFPRGPTDAPNFIYAGIDGQHEIWFDDAESTTRALGAWDYGTVSQDTGLFFWGLGAEDPGLWQVLSRRLP